MDLERLLETLPALPALPREMLRRLGQPGGCDLRAVAGLARKDPVVAGRLMRLGSLALFGATGQPETIEAAIMRLGPSETRKMVATIALVFSFREAGPAFDPRRFWTFALGSALCAERIAAELAYHPTSRAYLAGLTHRIGDAALALRFPESFGRAMSTSRARAMTLDESVKQEFGVSLASFSAAAIRHWGFPGPVVEAVAHRDSPGAAREGSALAWILVVSGHLCELLDLGIEPAASAGLAWIGELPRELAERLFPASESQEDDIVRRWSFLHGARDVVDALFMRS